jgi:hypothetical protein
MHRVWANGPQEQIQKLIENHFVEYENYDGIIRKHLDFETVIPSPEIVKQTQSSPSANFGAYLLSVLSGEQNYNDKHDLVIGRWENEEVDIAIKRYLERNPEYENFGRLQLQCLKETGFKGWYDWKVKYWGTKWNALEGDIESIVNAGDVSLLEFTMETAWNVPKPIFVELALLFPDIVFKMTFFDEGWVFAGEGNFNDPYEREGCNYCIPEFKSKIGHTLYLKTYGYEYFAGEDEETGILPEGE